MWVLFIVQRLLNPGKPDLNEIFSGPAARSPSERRRMSHAFPCNLPRRANGGAFFSPIKVWFILPKILLHQKIDHGAR